MNISQLKLRSEKFYDDDNGDDDDDDDDNDDYNNNNNGYLYAGYLQLYTWKNPYFWGRLYRVAAILDLQFVLHVMLCPLLNALCFYIGTSRNKCAVPNMSCLL